VNVYIGPLVALFWLIVLTIALNLRDDDDD